MNKHEYNIFPEMLPEDYNRLKADLQNNGYDFKYPIWIYEGKILDGWNRQRACNELRITPTYKDYEGSDIDAINFVMRTNKRRNLNSTQWACIAVEAEDLIDAIKIETERRRIEKISESKTGMKYGENSSDKKLSSEKNGHENSVATKLADSFNTNRTYINEAARFKKEDPEKFELLKTGSKTISEVKNEEKKLRRIEDIQRQRDDIASGKAVMPEGTYEIIAIDPPWDYGEKGGFTNNEYDAEDNRGAVDYPTMTVNEITNLKLPVSENAIVFLWTTHAFLRSAFDILEAWNAKYKATMVWDKDTMGIGRTLRMQCEFCLVGFIGSPTFIGSAERDIIRSKRRQHSRKPDEFYELVERATIGRKLEYFSREKRENWDTYGNNTAQF